MSISALILAQVWWVNVTSANRVSARLAADRLGDLDERPDLVAMPGPTSTPQISTEVSSRHASRVRAWTSGVKKTRNDLVRGPPGNSHAAVPRVKQADVDGPDSSGRGRVVGSWSRDLFGIFGIASGPDLTTMALKAGLRQISDDP